jgi:hypothetical protein
MNPGALPTLPLAVVDLWYIELNDDDAAAPPP